MVHQGLAIGGHSNNDECNLDQLLLLRKDDVPDLDVSPEIINEQIALMANQLLRSLLDVIKAKQCDQHFAIIADETRDISEQLALSLRWVDQSYEIYEDFIGMVSI